MADAIITRRGGAGSNITVLSVSLTDDTESWVETSTGGYLLQVTVAGILSTDTLIADIITSDDATEAEDELTSWANIYSIVANNGSLDVYAFDRPIISMTMQLVVVK